MSRVKVHNISDRPNADARPMAVSVGPTKIRPGKHAMVDSRLLNSKYEALHGKSIWIGELPGRFRRTSSSALKAKARTLSDSGTPAMTVTEARGYLQDLSPLEILALCDSMTPVLEFRGEPAKVVLVARAARACFMPNRILDPEKFFWLRRWVRSGDLFIEKE